jgi:hypothetical protein
MSNSLSFSQQTNDFNNNSSDDASCIHQKLNHTRLDMISSASLGEYVPTTIEVYKSEFKVNDEDFVLSITDLSGKRHDDIYVEMRRYYYLLEEVLLTYSFFLMKSHLNSKLRAESRLDFDVLFARRPHIVCEHIKKGLIANAQPAFRLR